MIVGGKVCFKCFVKFAVLTDNDCYVNRLVYLPPTSVCNNDSSFACSSKSVINAAAHLCMYFHSYSVALARLAQ